MLLEGTAKLEGKEVNGGLKALDDLKQSKNQIAKENQRLRHQLEALKAACACKLGEEEEHNETDWTRCHSELKQLYEFNRVTLSVDQQAILKSLLVT